MNYNPKIVIAWFEEHGLWAIPEYKFCETRKWKFDFAFLGDGENKIALEVEGGAWTGGRHTRGSGFIADIAKYNTATVLGWRLLRCVPADLCTLETLNMIRGAMKLSANA